MDTVSVIGFGRLKEQLGTETTVPAGLTAAEAVEILQIGPSGGLPLTAVVNGRVVPWEYVLQSGDKLVLVPTIGGGCQ